MNANSLYIMLPASILGAMRMSAFPTTWRFQHPSPGCLLVDRDVKIQRSVDDGADDLPRSDLFASAAASMVAGIFEFTVSTAARIATLGSVKPSARAGMIAFWTMSRF